MRLRRTSCRHGDFHLQELNMIDHIFLSKDSHQYFQVSDTIPNSIRGLMAINHPAVGPPLINPLSGNSEKISIMIESNHL